MRRFPLAAPQTVARNAKLVLAASAVGARSALLTVTLRRGR